VVCAHICRSLPVLLPAPLRRATLSLHDALPISAKTTAEKLADLRLKIEEAQDPGSERAKAKRDAAGLTPPRVRIDELLDAGSFRSEEHTSELQSRFDLVCRLLLEKKKSQNTVRT